MSQAWIPDERDGDKDPSQGVEIRHQRQDGGLGLGEDVLSDLDARGAERRPTGRSAALHGAALGQHLTRGRCFLGEGGRPNREALAPLPRRPEVDMEETRARVEAKPEESDNACRRLERDRIGVRHGDVECRTIHVLGTRLAADGAVVLWAAIGRADDQRIAQPVAESLQLIERGGVTQSKARSARWRCRPQARIASNSGSDMRSYLPAFGDGDGDGARR